MAQRILIVGATSAMAEAAARLWLQDGAQLVLSARDPAKLAALALRLGGVATLPLFPADPRAMAALVPQAVEKLGGLDAVLVAQGSLTDQRLGQTDPVYLAAEITVNLTGVVMVAEAAAAYFQGAGRGVIGIIGSVAGDRGKKRNYLYGLTKAALEIEVAGLRHRLAGTFIRAVLIKPGPTDTPMTATHPKTRLFSSAETVGLCILRAMRGNRPVVYAPSYWGWIMAIIRLIPESLFNRLDL